MTANTDSPGPLAYSNHLREGRRIADSGPHGTFGPAISSLIHSTHSVPHLLYTTRPYPSDHGVVLANAMARGRETIHGDDDEDLGENLFGIDMTIVPEGANLPRVTGGLDGITLPGSQTAYLHSRSIAHLARLDTSTTDRFVDNLELTVGFEQSSNLPNGVRYTRMGQILHDYSDDLETPSGKSAAASQILRESDRVTLYARGTEGYAGNDRTLDGFIPNSRTFKVQVKLKR